jgi:hypothetical protein
MGAIHTLLILDELFRSKDVVVRRRWVSARTHARTHARARTRAHRLTPALARLPRGGCRRRRRRRGAEHRAAAGLAAPG